MGFSTKFSVHPAENKYPTLFRAGKSGEEERHPTAFTPLPIRVGFVTATSPPNHWLRDQLLPLQKIILGGRQN